MLKRNHSKSSKVSLKDFLVEHEGYEKYPYKDTKGNLTIGIGHNLTANGLPDFMIERLFSHDVQIATRELIELFSQFARFSRGRQIALTSMMFQMGGDRFKGFKKMIQAIQVSDWDKVVVEALDSKWAREFEGRAQATVKLTKEN